MSRKNVILPSILFSSVSMGTSVTSWVFDVTYLDRCSIEINATTSDAVGFFTVEGSASGDYWVALDMDTMAVASADKHILIDIQTTGIKKMRVVYTRTSGTGTVTAYLTAKES